MGKNETWRKEELSFDEVLQKNPKMPPLVLLKSDVTRRGIFYTQAALDAVDPDIHQIEQRYMFKEKKNAKPVSITFRDGNSITSVTEDRENPYRTPYIIDVVDGKTVLIDQDKILEEIHYWSKPDYYRKKTSKGTPMWQVVNARPQRLDVMPNDQCHFWDKPGGGCKYCWAAGGYNKFDTTKNCRLDLDDLRETISEALRQPGRFSAVMFSGGTILSGKELLDDELEMYIEVIQAVGEQFASKRFPGQLISTAFGAKQLEKLYENTGLMNYTADLEVLDKEKFEWICPGKAEFIGYDGWKQRLFDAVDIFGKGNVNTGVVLGVELAKPYGFPTEEEAIKRVLEEAEDLYAHGVGVAGCVWAVSAASVFRNQTAPSLDYYAQVLVGLDELRKKYGFNPYMDDYRRCGSHPNTDIGRMG